MPEAEKEPSRRNINSEPVIKSELLPELAYFLKDHDYAMLMQATDQGTAFVVKAPRKVIKSLQGRVPIALRHELYQHPTAPVIRTVVTIYDQPDRPLAMETYTNIDESDQRSDSATLAERQDLLLLFYYEELTHRLTKRVPGHDAGTIIEVLTQAQEVRRRIPDGTFDFDRAKADVMRATTL